MRFIDATKVQLPKINASLIDRPQLLELMRAQSSLPLLLVCAPAGYGKTTLVARWAALSDRPVAWVGLNGIERRAVDVACYIVQSIRAALGASAADFGRAVIDRATTEEVPDTNMLATDLTTALAELASPITVVIDNYGAPPENDLNEFTAKFVAQLPDHVNAIMTSRSKPAIDRTQIRRYVGDIDQHALAFAVDETRVYLNDVLRLGLTADQIGMLQYKTEGWITGLRLASLTLHDSSDISASVETFTGTNRFVQSYFVDEVLSGQSEDLREFLLKTSIPLSYNVDLAEALTGRHDAADLLGGLERENLFLVPLEARNAATAADSDRGTLRWYRYHHLFADALRFRQQQESTDELASLNRRACTWFIEHQRPRDAIRHAIELRDWKLAVKLLEPLGGFEIIHFKALVDWIHTLPEEALRAQPLLSLWDSWSKLQAGHVRASERALDLAEQEWKTRGEARYRGETLYLRSQIARSRGEGPLTVSLAEQALAALPQSVNKIRIMSMLSIAVGRYISGEPVEAEIAARDAHQLAHGGEVIPSPAVAAGDGVSKLADDTAPRPQLLDDEIVGMSAAYLGRALTKQGRLTEAWDTFQQAFSRHAVPLNLSIFFSELLIERDELGQAAQLLDNALQRARDENAGLYKTLIWMMIARIAYAQGDSEAAMSTLDHILSWSRKNGSRVVQGQAEAFRARIWLDSGDHPKFQAWLDRYSIDEDADIPYDQEPAYYVFARFLLHQCRISTNSQYCDRALRILKQLETEATADKRNIDVVQALALSAVTRFERGDTATAFAHLERALSLSIPERAVRPFLEEGEPMLRLAQYARDRGVARDHIDSLIAAFDRNFGDKRPDPSSHESRIVELTKREQEILRYVAAGLTNQEIAGRMFISVNTVKTHLKHIFSKIGATSRAQAIARAFALGLL